MITVTPRITYSNQDFDEMQHLKADLRANPRDYLNHTDGFVRSMADWTMEYYKMRNLRPDITEDGHAGRSYLRKLYARLRALASTPR